MIKISCPQCKSILEFEHSASGSQRFCSSCGLSLIIPIIESQDHAKDSETDSEKIQTINESFQNIIEKSFYLFIFPYI